jgi:hypothetical protein
MISGSQISFVSFAAKTPGTEGKKDRPLAVIIPAIGSTPTAQATVPPTTVFRTMVKSRVIKIRTFIVTLFLV